MLLIICTCLCPTFFCAYRINSYCSLLYLRVFVHTFVHCTVPCVPSRVSHHRLCLGTVIWLHYIAHLSSCAMYYRILLGLCRSCAPRFLLCISLYASFFVTCSVSCTFCVYVICAPSHLAPRIPFLYTVVRHTLSVCRFSTLRRFGRFASDCIDTANLPHRDFVFIHPSSSASLVAGRLNYGVVQAVSAANVRGSVIRAHDVRKFAFSVNWARRADLPHILSYGFWASAHPFLSHYLTTCPSVLPNFVAAGSLV